MDGGCVLVSRVNLDPAQVEVEFGLKQAGGEIGEKGDGRVVCNERSRAGAQRNKQERAEEDCVAQKDEALARIEVVSCGKCLHEVIADIESKKGEFVRPIHKRGEIPDKIRSF